MDGLEGKIREVFRRVSSNTPQLGLADLRRIENSVLALLKSKIIVDE